jgi:hypothetical protein
LALGSETGTGVGLGALDGLALGDAATGEADADGAVAPLLHAVTTTIASSGAAI